MPKCNPQLLDTKILQGWEDAQCYNKNSVSLALIIMDLLPSSVACLACTKMRLSASSWKHLSRRSRQVSDVLKTSIPLVTTTTFGTVIWASLSARKWKRSVLLSLCLRELRQFDGTLFLFVTWRRPPWRRLDLVSILRLDGLYTSNTICVLLYFMV